MLNRKSEQLQARTTPALVRIARSHKETNHKAFLRISAFAAGGLALALVLLLSAGIRPAEAETTADAASANLGAPFQIDSGRIAERKGTTSEIRDYAHLMVVTHVPVVDALNKILQQKDIKAPQNTLLRGAYDAMLLSLKADRGAALNRDYIEGQVQY